MAPQAPHASISSGTSGMHATGAAGQRPSSGEQNITGFSVQRNSNKLKSGQFKSVGCSSAHLTSVHLSKNPPSTTTKLQTGTKKCQQCQRCQKRCEWRRRRRKLNNVAPQAPENEVNHRENTDFLKKILNFGRGVPSPPTETGGVPPPLLSRRFSK